MSVAPSVSALLECSRTCSASLTGTLGSGELRHDRNCSKINQIKHFLRQNKFWGCLGATKATAHKHTSSFLAQWVKKF